MIFMKKYKVNIYIILLVGLFLIGCTEKNFVSVPDSYNDQGKELFYAEERVEGEHSCGSFLKFAPNLDFQAEIDNAIEQGQKKLGEEYIVLADIIAWYETTSYVVYTTYCAKVTGFPARFDSDRGDFAVSTIENLPKTFDGKPIYYHSSTGIESNFNNFKYTIKNMKKDM